VIFLAPFIASPGLGKPFSTAGLTDILVGAILGSSLGLLEVLIDGYVINGIE
jgi:hypothetical protein